MVSYVLRSWQTPNPIGGMRSKTVQRISRVVSSRASTWEQTGSPSHAISAFLFVCFFGIVHEIKIPRSVMYITSVTMLPLLEEKKTSKPGSNCKLLNIAVDRKRNANKILSNSNRAHLLKVNTTTFSDGFQTQFKTHRIYFKL